MSCLNKDVDFKIFKNAKKQEQVFRSFIDLTKENKTPSITVKELLEISSSHQTLNSLVTKGIFSIEEKEISRMKFMKMKDLISFDLSDEQQNALNQIQKSFESKEVVLLHGVTSSGKTEIFIKLIQDVIARGRNRYSICCQK